MSSEGLGRVVMVVPTYNEVDNLEWIVGRLRAAQPDLDVLVVDDGSPDGTGAVADRLAASDPQVTVLHRTTKAGLGAAYLHGFRTALDAGYDVIGEMDADGSHQPEQLHRLLEALRTADLVIGSRYVPGGSVVNWPLTRQALSRGGNLYVRLLLGIHVRDATAGFRLFRREALEKIDLERRAEHRLRVPDRPGLPRGARRAARRRGADRVRRAGARRLQDERLGGGGVAAADHPLGAAGAPQPARPGATGTAPAMRRRRIPGWLLFVVFVVVPLVEIFVLIQVGQVIGAWWTIALLVADSLLGTWLIRREGSRSWAALRDSLQTGRMPARELADAGLILVGGTLMLTPGFVSDLVGILLILPVTRPVARRVLTRMVTSRLLASRWARAPVDRPVAPDGAPETRDAPDRAPRGPWSGAKWSTTTESSAGRAIRLSRSG